MRKNTKNNAPNLALVLGVIFVVVAGVLIVAFMNKNNQNGTTFCKEGEDARATNGVFCSDDFGFKMRVSDELKGKLAQSTSTKGTEDSDDKQATSLKSYAVSKKFNDNTNYKFEVSEYPMEEIQLVTMIFNPTSKVFTAAQNQEAESIMVNNKKVFVTGFGDAGQMVSASAFVHNDRLFVVQLNTAADPTNESDPDLRTIEALRNFYGSTSEMPASMSLEFKD